MDFFLLLEGKQTQNLTIIFMAFMRIKNKEIKKELNEGYTRGRDSKSKYGFVLKNDFRKLN